MICADFPVIYSTLSAIAIVERVLPLFGLANVERCELWHRGLSDIYLVQTPRGLRVLRVSHHHWRSRTDINFEVDFLNFLAKHQIPVAAPIATVEGDYVVEVGAPEGMRYATLFPFAPGEISMGGWTVEQSQRLGKVVAHIHQISTEFSCDHSRQALNLDYLLDESLSYILPFFGDRPHDWHFVQKTAEDIRDKLGDFSKAKPFWTVCWGDAHSGNVHFTKDQEITMFDFDQCGYGWRAFEIGKFYQAALTTGLCRKVREAFVTGYQSQTVFTEAEEIALQSLTQLAYIWSWRISLQNILLFNNSQLDRHYFTKRLERLRSLSTKAWNLF
ncbi:aminoglycoside phosphotransferase [[Leptolyngbya] sp. PCC 7376]|nr:aminoglycoside phosphotransferase [[Leptolyngbya] sp. PCC 7376]